ncbi:AAAP amino acid permease [Gymnopus androsaceus JB14]|uniref:AAAP amino acid permease n=1 Tax=Gymnopus androsaceus JB14 TaxID=1447944 RepID=A0A6A4II48_9AGAR|nr:AAAP amino acid permease [Gymnopus androsaceus JB14]
MPPKCLESNGDTGMASNAQWIAIDPIQRTTEPHSILASHNPPSFDESQYDIILRRQRVRPPTGPSLKSTTVPSRFLNLSNDFEFAGWGTYSKIQLEDADYVAGEARVKERNEIKILGQFTASALAGNAVLGSVFYAIPAVVAVASVYSPISLFIATLTLFVWRPIMEELGSAFPICGAPYSYILNISNKSLAILSAALLCLDFASTSVVSAATAISYLAGEVELPFPEFVGVILILVIFTLVSLSGIKESARVALCVLSFHMTAMTVLVIAGFVHWRRIGNAQITQNWHDGKASSASEIAKQIFNGFCLGMLGLTGFECTPAYIARIKPGRFPLVLRNLHYPAIVLNCVVMTLVLAIVPLETILQGDNVLSILAEQCVGKRLRTYIVVDAIIVLCGGVLTGILSACELLQQLSLDRLVPKSFCKVLPITNAPYVSVLSFVAFSGIVYASTGASLDVVSKMFSLVWLVVMSLFPLALLLLKFNRGRLPRAPNTSLSVVIFALILVPIVFAGNVVVDPTTAGYFSGFTIAVVAFFAATRNKTHILRCLYWLYDQFPSLHRWSMTNALGDTLINLMVTLKRQPVCILVKTDEINHLFHMILYVRDNEETTCVKIVHFVDEEIGVPSELEANARILDEAFPEITIDLIIVPGTFNPVNVATLAHHLDIEPSLMFMSCPGPRFKYGVAELGTRIITL